MRVCLVWIFIYVHTQNLHYKLVQDWFRKRQASKAFDLQCHKVALSLSNVILGHFRLGSTTQYWFLRTQLYISKRIKDEVHFLSPENLSIHSLFVTFSSPGQKRVSLSIVLIIVSNVTLCCSCPVFSTFASSLLLLLFTSPVSSSFSSTSFSSLLSFSTLFFSLSFSSNSSFAGEAQKDGSSSSSSKKRERGKREREENKMGLDKSRENGREEENISIELEWTRASLKKNGWTAAAAAAASLGKSVTFSQRLFVLLLLLLHIPDLLSQCYSCFPIFDSFFRINIGSSRCQCAYFL